MLNFMNRNKPYIWGIITVGLFGIAGFLLAIVLRYIVKAANRHPILFRWILISLLAFLYIYDLFVIRNWAVGFATACIAISVAMNSLNTDVRQ